MYRSFSLISLLVLMSVTAGAQTVFTNRHPGFVPASTLQERKRSADNGYDVFNPICKYIEKGDAESLSAWFADNLDISILRPGGDASRSQARQIVKSFFKSYTPRSFKITHTAGRNNMKYVLGELYAGGERFNVTMFLTCKSGTYRIQQLNINRN